MVPAYQTLDMDLKGWTMLAARFLFIYGITIPFDARDLSADMKSKISTIPYMIGGKKALLSAVVALVIGMGLTILMETPDWEAHSLASLVAIGLVLSWKANRSYFYYLLGLDGCILLHSCLIVGFKHLLT